MSHEQTTLDGGAVTHPPRDAFDDPSILPVGLPGATPSLHNARLWLDERLRKGARCPCCGQRAQLYRRSITSTMARQLVAIARFGEKHGTGTYAHLPTLLADLNLPRGGDEAKLVYWGLIAEEAVEREDGGRAGWWRVTMRGLCFAHGDLTVRRWALVYDAKLVDLEGPPISIHDALGKRFRLDDLLRGAQ